MAWDPRGPSEAKSMALEKIRGFLMAGFFKGFHPLKKAYVFPAHTFDFPGYVPLNPRKNLMTCPLPATNIVVSRY